MLDNQSFTFDQLERKYGQFYAPAFRIEIDGQNLNLKQVAVSSVRVDMTTEARADHCSFRIENAYNAVKREFEWVGSLIDVGKAIVVKMGYIDKLETVFDGIITGMTLDYPEQGQPTASVTAMDRSMLMMRNSPSNDWADVKISDVAKQIGSKYGLRTIVDETGATYKKLEQYDETDFRFLTRWAAKLFYEFFVIGQTMYFRKPVGDVTPVLTLSYGKNLSSYTAEVDISKQASQVVVHGIDPKTRKHFEGKSQKADIIGSNGRLGSDIMNTLSNHLIEHVYENVPSPYSAQQRANAIMNERALDLVTGNGSCIGIPELVAGRFVKLEGLGPKFNQPMLLSGVTHTIDSNGYMTSFSVKGNAI